jgi:hypothetical protein
MKYVILEGLAYHNRFYTMYTEDDDPTTLADGTVAYKVLGYADTDKEAQAKLDYITEPRMEERFQALYDRVVELERKVQRLELTR